VLRFNETVSRKVVVDARTHTYLYTSADQMGSYTSAYSLRHETRWRYGAAVKKSRKRRRRRFRQWDSDDHCVVINTSRRPSKNSASRCARKNEIITADSTGEKRTLFRVFIRRTLGLCAAAFLRRVLDFYCFELCTIKYTFFLVKETFVRINVSFDLFANVKRYKTLDQRSPTVCFPVVRTEMSESRELVVTHTILDGEIRTFECKLNSDGRETDFISHL